MFLFSVLSFFKRRTLFKEIRYILESRGGDIIKGNTVLAINHAHSKAETTIQIVIWGRPLQIQHISYFRCNLPEAN